MKNMSWGHSTAIATELSQSRPSKGNHADILSVICLSVVFVYHSTLLDNHGLSLNIIEVHQNIDPRSNKRSSENWRGKKPLSCIS
jgi:hypothetical protein